ncbi:MAG: hypothetical protein ABSE57_13025 [Bryobacteraceae bacterium]|jgi:hypothetical protein
MRILFDHGTPSGSAKALSGREVTEAIERGWDRTSNGELLELAEAAEFDILLTTDKGIRYQQNLQGRKIAIVVLGNSTWRALRLYLDRIVVAVNGPHQVATPRWRYHSVKSCSNDRQSRSRLRSLHRH